MNVLIVDDRAHVRAGIHCLLRREEGVRAREAASAREAIDALAEDAPDLVLLDLVMPGADGLAALSEIRAAAPDAQVVVLGLDGDPIVAREAFDAGASGYVLKDDLPQQLHAVIEEVAAGRRYLDPVLGARLASTPPRPPSGVLTEREEDVLRLVALGYTTVEIARRLRISARTVEDHRAHLGRKLGLHRRSEIVAYALEHGMLADRPPHAVDAA